MKYKKLPLSFQQQVNLLKNRGLSIPDEPRAIQYLSNISYYRVLQSWLHTLTYVRNICGHHGRLWNREVAIEPLWLKKAKLPWLSNHYQYATNRIFYVMCMIKYLLQTINPSHHLLRHFVDLINKYPNVPIAYMGIPSEGGSSTKLLNWQEENLWH